MGSDIFTFSRALFQIDVKQLFHIVAKQQLLKDSDFVPIYVSHNYYQIHFAIFQRDSHVDFQVDLTRKISF